MAALIQHSPPHPREIILEFFLSSLDEDITLEVAHQLSNRFNTTELFWLNLQRNFDAWDKVINDLSDFK